MNTAVPVTIPRILSSQACWFVKPDNSEQLYDPTRDIQGDSAKGSLMDGCIVWLRHNPGILVWRTEQNLLLFRMIEDKFYTDTVTRDELLNIISIDVLKASIPIKTFSLTELTTEPPPPRFIIDRFLPIDVAALVGTGGSGKSTLLLQMFISILLRNPFLGMDINETGPIILVTAEDHQKRIQRRLYGQLQQLGISPAGRKRIADNLYIVDLIGSGTRLVCVDKQGNLIIDNLANNLVKLFESVNPALIAFDPLVKFGPGERYINDAEDMLVNAGMYLTKSLDCGTLFSHHVSKAVFRNRTVDHHAGRGGSALGDGVRASYLLQYLEEENAGEEHYSLHVTKLTDAKPLHKEISLIRRGWIFEKVKIGQNIGPSINDNLDKVIEWLQQGRGYPSQRDMEALVDELGMSRAQLRAAIAKGKLSGRIVELQLPQIGTKGKRNYLAVAAPILDRRTEAFSTTQEDV
jgi:hypothetical protein